MVLIVASAIPADQGSVMAVASTLSRGQGGPLSRD